MDRQFVFRNYWWIAGAVAAPSITVIVVSGASGREGLIGGTLATALAFCYFAQQQKLAELRLFKDLFTDFNNRYNAMNDELERIRASSRDDDPKFRKTLVDYFNLCAEEYLFFSEGYIHRAAWRAWCRGMLYYLDNERMRRVWNDEVKMDSYYGLTFDIICEGAGRTAAPVEGGKFAK